MRRNTTFAPPLKKPTGGVRKKLVSKETISKTDLYFFFGNYRQNGLFDITVTLRTLSIDNRDRSLDAKEFFHLTVFRPDGVFICCCVYGRIMFQKRLFFMYCAVYHTRIRIQLSVHSFLDSERSE